MTNVNRFFLKYLWEISLHCLRNWILRINILWLISTNNTSLTYNLKWLFQSICLSWRFSLILWHLNILWLIVLIIIPLSFSIIVVTKLAYIYENVILVISMSWAHCCNFFSNRIITFVKSLSDVFIDFWLDFINQSL